MIKELIALVLKLLTDIGLWKVVSSAIKNAIRPYKTRKGMKACVFVGELVVTGVISDKTGDYIDESMDKAAKFLVDHGWDKKFLKLVRYKEEYNGGNEQLDER